LIGLNRWNPRAFTPGWMSNSNNTFARIPYTGDRKPLELCLEGECLLYYQPQLDLQTGSLAGVEVLLRSHSPELGWIPPDRFIPIAFINWIDLARRANGF
jgi:EAL domain-containing protein (putative c-di-GMP-specific phosphodiesterase class I)